MSTPPIVARAALLAAAIVAAAPAGWQDVIAPAAAGASGACSPRLQSFFASDFKDTAYQQKAFQKVAKGWKRPAASPKPGAKAVVIATIAADGKAAPPMLHMKSGSAAWDDAALAAVRAASPFDPLPKTYAHPSVEVHFHFECAAGS